MIWEAYKNRMGTSNPTSMLFDLQGLIPNFSSDELMGALIREVTSDEIDLVVRLLPTGKAPGPDGFNGRFFSKNTGTLSRATFTTSVMIFFLGQLTYNLSTTLSSL